MRRRYITLPMLLLALSLLSGCGTIKKYEGPALPKSQVAVLSPVCCVLQAYNYFCIEQIDGKPIDQPCFIGGHMPYKFELLPGRHTVSVTHTKSSTIAWGGTGAARWALFGASVAAHSPSRTLAMDFTFEAKAGHTYDIGLSGIKDTTTDEKKRVLAEEERGKLLVTAKKGGPEAQFRVALLSSSADERRKWLSLAANQGHAEAQFRLYTRDKPDGKSLTWLCLAANQGHALAQEELGDLHVLDLGQAWREAGLVKLDRVRAHMWHSLATANDDARRSFTSDYLTDQMTPEQIAEAERLVAEWKPGDCGAEASPTKSAG